MVATSLVLDLAESVDPRYRPMILLAGFAGLRTGESLGLRRHDVDLLHGEVHVRRQAQEIAGHGRMVLDPKSEAGRRTVALPSIVVDALDRHMANYPGSDADVSVLTGPAGGPLRRATFSRVWQVAVAATGAPAGLRPHDLRHHAATLTAWDARDHYERTNGPDRSSIPAGGAHLPARHPGAGQGRGLVP